MDKSQAKNRRVALSAAAHMTSNKGNVRKVLTDAMFFEKWLRGDETAVAIELKDRYPDS